MKANQIISFSGGKDSTAMTIIEPDKILAWFNTGWSFPEMTEHIDQFDVTELHPRHPFDELVIKYGWPSMRRRWCTREKIDALNKNAKGCIQLIGFSTDEIHRTKTKAMQRKPPPRFPLIEKGLSKSDVLSLCKEHGYTWGGLYDRIDSRISCYCCPLKSSPKVWKRIRKQYPELWEHMLWLDNKITEAGKNGGFYGYKTVHDLETRFEYEDRQEVLAL